MKLILFIIVVSSQFAWATCNEGRSIASNVNTEVSLFKIQNSYQVYLDGSNMVCENKCFSQGNCVEKCKTQRALELIKKDMKNQYGRSYASCGIWKKFIKSSLNNESKLVSKSHQ